MRDNARPIDPTHPDAHSILVPVQVVQTLIDAVGHLGGPITVEEMRAKADAGRLIDAYALQLGYKALGIERGDG
jgi:hypothetical protein